MKGFVKAGEGLCLKTWGVNCALFHHLTCAHLKFLKKLKLFTSIQREKKVKGRCGTLEPIGVSYLGSMLTHISKEAGTSVIYTIMANAGAICYVPAVATSRLWKTALKNSSTASPAKQQ